MTPAELALFERRLEEIDRIARSLGLDYYPVRFEVVPAQVMYTFGAYGMPRRFSHWSFGKAYHRMKTEYDFNLSRIYELVINANPAYAFLLEGNSLLQNLVVAAHVLAHVDFFKNNARFRRTARDMVETMAVHAERIRAYEFKYGREAVERVLDAALAIQDQVDPYTDPWAREPEEDRTCRSGARLTVQPRTPTPICGPWTGGCPAAPVRSARRPTRPAHPAGLPPAARQRPGPVHRGGVPILEPWERDVLLMIRQEMLYFWPQLETKIMNEGWATYFHTRIMRALDLSDAEALEFAQMHAGVIQPSPHQINPYLLGLKLFESIERRWDHPTPEERERWGRQGGEGRAKIFEVRETETDLSFIRNYLTKELVEELDLYLYAQVDGHWQVVEKDWERVRDHLVQRLTHCGIPYIVVEDGDYRGRGELLLRHRHEGWDLDRRYALKTLEHLYRLWGKPVHLATVEQGRERVYVFDGESAASP